MSAQKTLHNRIMQPWPECFDCHIIAGGMNAVGQQDDYNRSVKIHPERGAGKAEMTDTVGGKKMAGA